MSDVATLRRAASVLRERAGNATPGPWTSSRTDAGARYSALVAPTKHPDRRGACWDYDPAYGGCLVGESLIAADREYIALMHPPVALALADWLGVAAADEWAHGPHCPEPCLECDDDPRATHVRAAYAVARAVLREAGE